MCDAQNVSAVEPSEPEGRGSLLRSSFGTATTSVAGVGLRFITQLLLSNVLGANGYGTFLYARGWGELLGKVPDRGYHLAAVQFLPRFADDERRFRGFIRTVTIETLAGALALACLGIALLTIGGRLSAALALGLLLTFGEAAVKLCRVFLQSVHRFATANAFTELVRPIVALVVVGCLYFFDALTATSALATMLGAGLVVSVLQWQTFKAIAPANLLSGERITEREVWVASARPHMVSQTAVAVFANADLLLVGLLLAPVDAALYGAASRIAVLGRFSHQALESVAASRISEDFGRGDLRSIQGDVDRVIMYSSMATLGFTLVAWLFATPILRLFGPEFPAGRNVLILLVLSGIPNALTGPSGFVAAFSGQERRYAVTMACAAVALIGLGLVLIPLFGIEGMAIAYLVASTGWNLALIVQAKQLGIRCYPPLPRRVR